MFDWLLAHNNMNYVQVLRIDYVLFLFTKVERFDDIVRWVKTLPVMILSISVWRSLTGSPVAGIVSSVSTLVSPSGTLREDRVRCDLIDAARCTMIKTIPERQTTTVT